MAVAVDRYREVGLAGTIDYFASPGSALAGLDAAIDYYNAAEIIDGHSDPSMIGRSASEIFVTFTPQEFTELTADGEWVDVGWLRVFMAEYDGYLFGSGWSRDE